MHANQEDADAMLRRNCELPMPDAIHTALFENSVCRTSVRQAMVTAKE